MKSGFYRIYTISAGKPGKTYIGRVAVMNGHTEVLEDHGDGFVYRLIPDGPIDAAKSRKLDQIAQNPYLDLVNETDLDAKAQPEPEIPPDEVFEVVDDHLGSRARLEVFGDQLFLDNKHLEDAEARHLLERVSRNELHLLPAD
jgi:hypothetical protein